jgi:hypothetical protein
VLLICILPLPCAAQEVTVLPGYDEAIEWLESIDWWGEELRGAQEGVFLSIPAVTIAS